MAKKFRVEFEYIETDGNKRTDKMTIPLSPQSRHAQADGREKTPVELEGPWIVDGAPFEGELEDYEVAMLKARPGVHFSPAWRFTLTEV